MIPERRRNKRMSKNGFFAYSKIYVDSMFSRNFVKSFYAFSGIFLFGAGFFGGVVLVIFWSFSEGFRVFLS